MSQNDIVLSHLKNFGAITQKDATDMYGITRLASRISDLRGRGCGIKSEQVKVPRRFGGYAYVSRYTLVREDND